MRRYLILSTGLAVLLLALLPVAGGCTVGSQQTSATLGGTGTGGADDPATIADTAITELTASDNIETPPTIATGLLRVGCDIAFPPLEYLAIVARVEGEDEVQEVKTVGFEVDLCTAIAKKMGLEPEILQFPWDSLVPALAEGQFDIIMSAMVTSPDLLNRLGATDPYLEANLAICTPPGAPVEDAAGLAGKIVGVQIDSVAQATVEEIKGVKEIRTYAQILGAFEDLAAGQLDAVITDELVSVWILDNDADYEGKCANTGRLETGEGYAFWCAKDNEVLLEAMNTALQELRDEGVYQKICKKWSLTGN